MAEEGHSGAITSAFPAPPPFYKSFTTDNLDSLQGHLETTSSTPLTIFKPTDPTHDTLPDLTGLPIQLQNLVPPPIPKSGTYRTFNTVHDVESSNASSLPAPPTQDQLLQTLRQILLKFLHITHILSLDPSMKYYAPAWEQLEALFKEIHAGINAWRPHQARETLIKMMEEQIRSLKEETQSCRDSVSKAKEVVEGISRSEAGDQNGVKHGERAEPTNSEKELETKERKQRGRKLWEAIEREVGSV